MKEVKTEVKKLLAKIVIGAHVFKPRLQEYRTRPNSRPALEVRYRDYRGQPDRVSCVDRAGLESKLTDLVNRGFVAPEEARAVTADTIAAAQKFEALEKRAQAYGISAAEAVDISLASMDILERKHRPENAARYYMDTIGNGFSPRRTGVVVGKFLASKRPKAAAGVRRRRDGAEHYYGNLRGLLGKFARSLRKRLYHEVKAGEMDAWLRENSRSDESFNDHRRALKALSNFAEMQRYLPRNLKAEVDFVPRKRIDRKEPPALEPTRLRRLLAEAFELPVILWLVVKSFTGGRTDEVKRLTRLHFKPGKEVDYSKAIVKRFTQGRFVPIQAVLDAWLRPFYGGAPTELIFPEGAGDIEDQVAEFARSIGVDLKRNILRKTYSAMRLAQIKDPGKVAYEMGSTRPVLYAHYLSVRAQEACTEYFSLFPPPDWETCWREILEERRAAAQARRQEHQSPAEIKS